jgi:membrane protein DedA with SNARE-associated domain
VTRALALYAAMILAAAFQEEFAPLAGALAAHHGHGEIWLVGAACAAGSWLHGVALYILGRRGRAMLQRPAMRRPIELLHRHRITALLGIRFAYGLRLTLPLVCGAADIGFGIFALYTAFSSAAWAALFTTGGWFLGEFAVTQLRHFRRYEIRAGIVLLGLGALAWLWRRRKASIETGEPRVV